MTPTVVFIHGAGISSWMWRSQITGLSGFRALAIDLPGHGTAKTPWTSVSDAAAAVARTIRRRVPSGKAHVVGLSLGGVVAIQLLAQDPDTVDRMLVSGTLAAGLPGAGFLAGLTALSLPLGKWRPMIRLSARMLKIPEEDSRDFSADVGRLEPGPLRRMILDVAAFRPPAALAHCHHQVLVVAGGKEHPKIRQSVRILAASMPNGRGGLIPEGIHTWNWQLPDRFNELVSAWLHHGAVPDFLIPGT